MPYLRPSSRPLAGLLLALLACTRPASAPTAVSLSTVTVLTAATLWDGTGRPPIPDAVLVSPVHFS